MATTPARNTRRDPQTGRVTTDMEAEVPLGGMQEPMGTMDRPVDPTIERRDDLNIRNTSMAPRSERGFGTTFAIAAAVLLVAFLVALYLGMSGPDNTSAPDISGQSSIPETTPSAGNQTTGSDTTTTTLPVQTETTGQTPTLDTGTGTTGTTGSTGTTGTTGTTNQ